jgi:hypothetical protein
MTFDVAAKVNAAASGFYGAAFDGRFITFVPNAGVAARFDTKGMFGAASSWSTFDVTTVDPAASGFYGAAFDGQYIYFVPRTGTTVARFDAKRPPSLPSGYSGSFY